METDNITVSRNERGVDGSVWGSSICIHHTRKRVSLDQKKASSMLLRKAFVLERYLYLNWGAVPLHHPQVHLPKKQGAASSITHMAYTSEQSIRATLSLTSSASQRSLSLLSVLSSREFPATVVLFLSVEEEEEKGAADGPEAARIFLFYFVAYNKVIYMNTHALFGSLLLQN